MKEKEKYLTKTGKSIIVITFFLMATVTSYAQYETEISLLHTPSENIKRAMEKNGTLLLTEFNNAQGEKRQLSLKDINIDKEAASFLFTMWEICPFRCDELEILESCLKTKTGYQIRNIPVIMEPGSGERFEEDRYQEIVLNFDTNGGIIDVCIALASSMYQQIMRSDLEVTDLRRRSMVIDFVEQFRTAYNRKDISFIKDIFSDDALIITGKVVKRAPVDGSVQLKTDVELVSQTKHQYITNLGKVFANNARINVIFDEVKVNKHRTNNNIYGVKLIQYWNSGSYNDKGYLFLLWDFTDEDAPKIHVRAWQPFDETPKEKVLELGDFNFKSRGGI